MLALRRNPPISATSSGVCGPRFTLAIINELLRAGGSFPGASRLRLRLRCWALPLQRAALGRCLVHVATVRRPGTQPSQRPKVGWPWPLGGFEEWPLTEKPLKHLSLYRQPKGPILLPWSSWQGNAGLDIGLACLTLFRHVLPRSWASFIAFKGSVNGALLRSHFLT